MKHLFFIISLLFAVSGFSQSDTTKAVLKRRPTPVWEIKGDTMTFYPSPEGWRDLTTGFLARPDSVGNYIVTDDPGIYTHSGIGAITYGGIADPYYYRDGISFAFDNEPPQFRSVMYGKQLANGIDSFILDSSSQYYVKRWPVKQSEGIYISDLVNRPYKAVGSDYTTHGEDFVWYIDFEHGITIEDSRNADIPDIVNRATYFEYRIKDTSNNPLFTAYVPLKKQITIDTMLAMFNHWPEPTQTTLKGLYQVNVALFRQKEPAKKEEDILLDAMSETLDSLLKLIEK